MKAETRVSYSLSGNPIMPCWAKVRVRIWLEGEETNLGSGALPDSVYYPITNNYGVSFHKSVVDLYCYQYEGDIGDATWETLRKHARKASRHVVETVKSHIGKALLDYRKLEELQKQKPPEEVWEEQI